MRSKHVSLLLAAAIVLIVRSMAWAGSAEPVSGQSTDLSPIVVTASADASAAGVQPPYAGGQVARGGRVGIFGSQDIMDTPFSITNYTHELIANQQAESVGDVLQNDPAVRVARGFGNYQQLYMVRGLPVYSDDMSYNGLYGLLPRQYLAAELLERVEVLHGASAFLNGAAPGGSGLGGAVNVSPKRAPNAPLDEFTIGTESGSPIYLAADVARRFGPEENFGVRFNAVQRSGGTGVDGERRDLTVFAIGLDYHQSGLRISADAGYQDYHLGQAQPSITIGPGLAIPSAPDADVNQAQPWTYSNERDVFGTLRAEYDITSYLTVWAAGGLRDGHEASVLANPTVTAADGATTQYRFDNIRRDLVDTGELGIRARFDVGGVSQQWIASVAAYQLNSKNAYATSNFAGFGGNIYSPTYTSEPAADYLVGGELGLPLLTARTKTSSAAIADQLGFLDEQLLVSVGARYQKIESFSYDYDSGDLTSSYSKSRVTPVAGIVAKLNPSFSVYANYIEGLVAGDIAPTTYTDASGAARNVANAGEVFSPYATRQGELGVKYDGGRIGGTLSVFYSAKPVYAVNQATSLYEVSDYQRNRGAELSVYGEAGPGVRILGGTSWLYAEASGERPIGAPRWQSNLGAEWDVPFIPKVTVTGRIVDTSAQYADAANTQEVPSWWRLDLGARYAFDVGHSTVTLRGRVDNVTDRDQWVSAGGYPGAGYLVLGTPRTFTVSGTVSF